MTLRLVLLLLAAGLAVQSAPAQSPPADQQAVRATIDALFDGMRAGDSSAVRAVFHRSARLQTARGPADSSTVSTTSVEAFVRAVGQPRERVWDERIWDVAVRVDGPMATAWVPYVFYRGEERSHCGVNAMQFVETTDGWKLLHLVDTRRSACDVPPDVQK
jgi:hypothetical protein